MQHDRSEDRVAAVNRMIDGRLELINRLFDDVRALTEERDRLAGRNEVRNERAGLLSRLIDRTPAPPR